MTSFFTEYKLHCVYLRTYFTYLAWW